MSMNGSSLLKFAEVRTLLQPPNGLTRKGVHCDRLLRADAVHSAFDNLDLFLITVTWKRHTISVASK